MCNSAICSRSPRDKYRPVVGGDDGERCDGGMPPCSRNHLVPTACDTPAICAASSLEHPPPIASQNGRRSARCKTGGRPGDLIFARPDRTFLVSIATSKHEVLRRSIEFALPATVPVMHQDTFAPGPARVPHLVQCVEHEVGLHGTADSPAHDV